MNENMTIFLAEDEGNDVFLMQRAIRKMNAPINLQRVKDGEEAIEYLSGRYKYADRELYPLPNLILLDINMPRKTGFDVLEWLKQQVTLNHIPVIMLTSSKVKTDKDRALVLGASAYLVKPLSFDQLKQLFTCTEQFLATHISWQSQNNQLH
ncbi:MAG: response regulator [Verrucomicrobia bacterium]|nr:response regulator [Verrucomicrobiota bacterium]